MNKKIFFVIFCAFCLFGCAKQKSSVREVIVQQQVEEEVPAEILLTQQEVNKVIKKKLPEKEKNEKQNELYTRLRILNNTENAISQVLITENNKAPFCIYLKIEKNSFYDIDVARGKEFLIEVMDEKNHRYVKENLMMFDTVNAEVVFTDKDFVSSGAKDLVTKFFGK